MSEHEYKTRSNEECFVIYYGDKPLHVSAKGWNDWRPPKKIYATLGAAKAGMNPTNLPKGFDTSKLHIVRYTPSPRPEEAKECNGCGRLMAICPKWVKTPNTDGGYYLACCPDCKCQPAAQEKEG